MNVVCVQERLSRQKKKSPLSDAHVDNEETERKLWMSEWLSFPVYMSRRTVHKEGKQTRFYKPSLWIWPRMDEEASSPFVKFSFRFNSETRSEYGEVPDVSSPYLSWYASSAHSVDRSAPVASSRVNAFSIERWALERRRTNENVEVDFWTKRSSLLPLYSPICCDIWSKRCTTLWQLRPRRSSDSSPQ